MKCADGTGPNANQTGCEPCAGATYSTTGTCQPCPSPNSVDLRHTKCSAPFRCPDARTFCATAADCAAQRCQRCPSGSVAKADGAVQRCECQPNMGELFTPGQTACDCKPGFYSPGPNSTCVSCAELLRLDPSRWLDSKAVVCPGGPRHLATAFPGRGWWKSAVGEVTAKSFRRCLPSSVCSGYNVTEANASRACSGTACCRAHHTGPLCGQCTTLHGFIESHGECIRCQSTQWAVLCTAAAAYAAWSIKLEHSSWDLNGYKDGSTLAIMTFYAQTLALLASENFYGLSSLVNLDVNSVGTAEEKLCITSLSPFQASIAGMVATPLFMAVIAGVCARYQSLAALALLRKSDLASQLTLANGSADAQAGPDERDMPNDSPAIRKRVAHKAPARALLEIGMYSYLGISKKAMGTLFCRTIDGASFVAMDMTHKCHDDAHILMISLAAMVLMVLTLGLPLVIVIKALQHRNSTKTRRELDTTTFIRVISLFNAKHNWWMAWLLMRRAMLAAAFVYGQVNGQLTIGDVDLDWRSMAFVILITSCLLQTYVMPFRLPADNMLEQVSLLMLMLALYLDIADTSAGNRVARVGIALSLCVVTYALLGGESPMAQKARHIATHPRESARLAANAGRHAGVSAGSCMREAATGIATAGRNLRSRIATCCCQHDIGDSRDGDGDSLAAVADSLRVSEPHLDLNDTQVTVANPASQENSSAWNGMTVEARETDI